MLILFSPYYLIYTVMGLILLPALIFSIVAQTKVSTTFAKYNKQPSINGYSAYRVARAILDEAGLQQVEIINTKGTLNCYYNQKTQTLALSDDVYHSSSVAAIGVAAHEAGHALQYQEGYLFSKMRTAMVPLLNITGNMTWPLLIAGILLLTVFPGMTFGNTQIGRILIILACSIYALGVLFSLVTLPAELNASRRAKTILKKSHILIGEENKQCAKVLNAAALTYVAALLTSLLSLIRIILYSLLFVRRKR